MNNADPRTDRDALSRAYASDENLAIRYRTHERYSEPKIDFRRWALDVVEWSGDEWVLDVGAGPGSYFEAVSARTPDGWHAAGDLSYGMAQQARAAGRLHHFDVLNFDVQHLPFPDSTFDVVLANHMLYHVPALPQTLAEIHRVLRPDGLLIAATNGERTMPELETLARRACTLLGYPRLDFNGEQSAFSLERGPGLLSHTFRAVARYDSPSAFHFPEVDPVLDYLTSLRPLREPHFPQELDWGDFMNMMEKQITRLIRHYGELKVNKLAGVLVATDGGGFARDYLARLDAGR